MLKITPHLRPDLPAVTDVRPVLRDAQHARTATPNSRLLATIEHPRDTYAMFNEPKYEYEYDVRDEWAGSAPGSIDCYLVEGLPEPKRVGSITFNLFEEDKIVQTHMLNNYGYEETDPTERREGLCMAMFRRLMERYPTYEFRTSGAVEEMRPGGQHFIKAVRNGNKEKGRSPLPYHESTCFVSNPDGCECGLGGRVRGGDEQGSTP